MIGGVQPTPVAAVLAYTMQHMERINETKECDGGTESN